MPGCSSSSVVVLAWHLVIALGLCSTLGIATASASTWDEPWHEEVVVAAASFVRVRVLGVRDDSVDLELEDVLAGAQMPKRFTVEARAGSFRDDAAGESWYLFVQGKKAPYEVISSTSSVSVLADEGLVQAIYRMSAHKALVPRQLYEWTQHAIFQAVHDRPYDENKAREFLLAELQTDVASLDDEDTSRFFRQHVALEMLAHLKGGGIQPERLVTLLEPFLRADSFHVQISAVRALARIPSRGRTERLLQFVDSHGDNRAKVVAVDLLWRGGSPAARRGLASLVDSASDEDACLICDIMDPRMLGLGGSVREAIEFALNNWEQRPGGTVHGQRGCGHCSASTPSGATSFALPLLCLLLVSTRRRYQYLRAGQEINKAISARETTRP